MPESVKISELPVLSSVNPNDIIPVVDEFVTQTSRCKASQIAALGGGPPAVNSVSTDKLTSGAVTAEKIGFTGPDKLISRLASGAGPGVEIPCTAYARGLLSSANASLARDYLDALQSTDNPTFSGQVKVARGSAEIPSLAPFDEPSTGIFFPEGGAFGVAYSQQEVFRLDEDGTILARYAGESVLRPLHPAAGWVTFNGLAAAASTIRISANQREIARRYGLTGTIGDNATTRTYMQSVETARGITLAFPTDPTFNDKYGKGNNLPLYNRGTETRANYTTPGDNKHWVWNGSQWTQVAASGLFWIGTIDLSFATATSAILQSRNIASVQRTGTGAYTVRFGTPMPDANYCIIATCSATTSNIPGVVRPLTTAADSFTVSVLRVSDYAAFDPASVNIAVFR